MAIKKSKKRVLVAMSGGVDSSVAAKLLKDQGHDVTGVFLHFWKDADLEKAVGQAEASVLENKCCSLQALLDAKAVAQKIGMELHTFNFSEPFKLAVVDNFLQEYSVGRTPNPCVLCNKKVKIGRLLEQARGLGFDYVATGHYLKLKKVGSKIKLYKAKDKNKDQSYFLYTFNQEQLKHLLFPLGNYIKPQVRTLAKKFKLPVAEKAESQEICFIPGKHHNDFLKKYLKMEPGAIKLLETAGSDVNNKKELARALAAAPVIGRHQGLPLYTIGQRRGIEIGGNGPYYVAKFDWKNNDLYVVKNFNEAILYGSELIAQNVSWLNGGAPKLPFKCEAVIRYRHPAVKCVLEKIAKKGQALNYVVKFKEPQRAITPGQSIVFYKGQEVLGGGIID